MVNLGVITHVKKYKKTLKRKTDMKKGVLFGLAAVAVGVVVASLGGKKDKPKPSYAAKSYWNK
ncbi:hypothetical protein [Jiulongibacter sp. NS-SX5]|uniref:hypothetical protein n=1 Tax=Jiulongibacter sp. NS-SX5 TaxID=3463854 RepID=UPI00405948F9